MALPNFRSSPCAQHARNPAVRITPACKGFTLHMQKSNGDFCHGFQRWSQLQAVRSAAVLMS
jgi:hypothetical protein